MRIFKLIAFLIFASLTSGCNPIYVANAGYHQARLLLGRESSEDLLKSKKLEENIRKKIELAIEVREFAKTLGLEVGEKYNTVSFYKFPNLWVMTAAPQFSLEPYTWWFPVVGDVPYKGYFEKNDAINGAEKLAEKKLDVSIRTASAFSTLGWFEDPLTSSLLELDELEFVNTIFHELFHSTVWFKNEVEINETLANAFGFVASLEFYKAKDDARYSSINEAIIRRCSFSARLEQIKARLENIYTSDKSDELKIIEKKHEFNQFKETFKKNDELVEDEALKKYSEINNAFFLGLFSYYQGFDKFVNYFESGNSLKSNVEELKALQESGVEENLFNLIESKVDLNPRHNLCINVK